MIFVSNRRTGTVRRLLRWCEGFRIMGYDIDRFVNTVDDDFKCSICLAVLENPLATPCGHVFCANCVLPWVVEHSTCPLKCGKFSPRELNNVLPLRNLILKLEIRCDNFNRGCGKICKIAMLGQHLEECENQPVKCSNKGCQKVLDVKDRVHHETMDCEFRPAGVCDQGCGLPVPVKDAGEHDCVKALLAHVGSIQAKLSSQDRNLKKTSLRHTKREKSLLAQIACYQNEIQMQGLRHQKQMNECQAEIEYLSSLATLEKRQQPMEENELTVHLKRNTNGSLGFNIIGGTKVNGKDLSKASHEEAVEAFKNATEPIIVQVLRRTENSSQVPIDKMVCNAGTQTELQSGDLLWKVLQTYQIEKSDSLEGLCEITPQDPLSSLDADIYDDLDAMDNLAMPIIDEDDLDRAFDFEYEDITLKRANKEDKLGLTLCYGGEEGEGGIFISEVEPGSIAAEDDRLREGDQILQINGEDVENREQALKLFSEKQESLTLLVCRPQYQLDDCLLDERGNSLLDELKMDMLEQTHQEAMQYTAFHHYQNLTQDEDGRTDTTGTTENNSIHHEKDSGVGRATDESVRNDSDGGEDGSTRKYPLSMNSGDLRYSNESFTSNELVEHELNGGQGLSVEDCQKFQAELENKCDKHVRSDTDESYQGKESKVMRLGSDSMDTTSQSGDSLNRPAKLMTPENENNIEALIVDTSSKNQESERWLSKSKPGVSPSLSTGSSISDVNVLTDVLTDVTSMSSTVSGPLDSNKLGSPKRKHSDKNGNKDEDDEESAHVSLIDKSQRKTSQGSMSRQHRAPRTVPGSPNHRSKSSSSSRERQRSSSSSGSTKDKTKENKSKENQLPLDKVPPLSSALPYPRRPCTNPHIRAQLLRKNPYLMQQVGNSNVNLFSQNLKLKHQNYFLRRNLETMGSSMGSMQSLQSVPGYARHYRSYLHLVKQNEENLGREDNREREEKEKVATEWKVKIRSDGTRYITRKTSARDRVLKDRENKLREERCGMTTDDEAVSEMKLGKYWSREDRKKHLEKARDQKRRREFMHRARMECLQEQAEDEGKREQDIVELSRKKMLKRKGRKLMLDDFTTVQEMLVHATKGSPDSSRDYNPLLNVTMV